MPGCLSPGQAVSALDVERRDRLWRFAPLGVGLLAFVLGLVRLTGQPRSYDERVTIRTATRLAFGALQLAHYYIAPGKPFTAFL